MHGNDFVGNLLHVNLVPARWMPKGLDGGVWKEFRNVKSLKVFGKKTEKKQTHVDYQPLDSNPGHKFMSNFQRVFTPDPFDHLPSPLRRVVTTKARLEPSRAGERAHRRIAS